MYFDETEVEDKSLKPFFFFGGQTYRDSSHKNENSVITGFTHPGIVLMHNAFLFRITKGDI